MKESLLSKLGGLAKALPFLVTIGGGALGCVPPKTNSFQERIDYLHRQTCTEETRNDIKQVIQQIIDDSLKINWNEIAKDCADDGKYKGKYDCAGKTATTLRNTYGLAVNKLVHQNTGFYCPYGDKDKRTKGYKAFTEQGDDRDIFIKVPLKGCALAKRLVHEAVHLVRHDNNDRNFNPEIHNRGTDYVYMLGQVEEDTCKPNESDLRINDQYKFLKDHPFPETP